ncbi:MAG: peptidoglycan D,D-transpeptidase FtsI family protein [Acidimicrobiales bacterium]
MNRPLRRVMLVLLVCFTLLFVQLNRVQVFQTEALQDNPANTRRIQREFDRVRGDIVTSDRVLVATTDPAPGGPFANQRRYPEGSLYAHTVGYVSFTVGAEGVERAYLDEITGQSPAQQLSDLISILDPDPDAGTLVLTLDHGLQQVARDALGERPGSVVALDPRTGAVLAMYSYPTFDPNLIADNDSTASNAAFQELRDAVGNPLRAKAYRDIFFPGSTFKVITAAAALETGTATIHEPVFEATAEYVPPLTNRPITNFSGRECGGDLSTLLVRSCNTPFAELAAERLGPFVMINQAEAAGFNSVPPFDLPGAVASNYPTLDFFGEQLQAPTAEIPAGVFENTPLLAQTAIGQNEVQASPLEMALMVAGVANGGIIPTPHVMAEVRGIDGRALASNEPDPWRMSMRPENAQALREALVEADEVGEAASVPGLEIGVKTGTAQLGLDPPRSHAWIVGFAGLPGGEPQIAVAVLVEGQEGSSDQTGGLVAGPIARALFDAYVDRNAG